MKKSRFSETQIIAILKEADAGMKVEDVCRQHGISNATYYNWKSKYGGLDASALKRLKELEAENLKLKKLYAEASLENHVMKELFAKKRLVTADKKDCANVLVEQGLSIVKACMPTSLSRSGFYRQQRHLCEADAFVI